MDKYARTAAELLPLLGGPGNVITLTHCVTRIRISLTDRHAIETTALRDHPAVLGQLNTPDAYHLIVGPAVAEPLTRACHNAVIQQRQPNLDEPPGCSDREVAPIPDSLTAPPRTRRHRE